ncbi:MAG: SAM-dependent methyltransferase, partial [Deltaproteobacteria bacterium]
MEADRIKWNRRFESEDSFLGVHPSPFLSREIDRIKVLVPGHTALDIACGEGRNSVFLAQNGFLVTGLDISDVGLSKGIVRANTAGVI